MKFCVYFYYIGEELVYIGKSINVYERYLQHCYERDEFKKVDRVGVMECDTKTDMDLLEVYYITKLKPRMNGTHADRDKCTFEVEHNEIVEYSMDEFGEKYGKETYKNHDDFEQELNEIIPFINEEINNGKIIEMLNNGIYCFQNNEFIYKIYLHNSGNTGLDLVAIKSNNEKNNFVINNTMYGKYISYVLNKINHDNIKIEDNFEIKFIMNKENYLSLLNDINENVKYNGREIKTNGIIFIESFNKKEQVLSCYPLYEIRYNSKKEQIRLVKNLNKNSIVLLI